MLVTQANNASQKPELSKNAKQSDCLCLCDCLCFCVFFFGAKKGATGIPSSNGNDNAQNRNYAAIEFGESIFQFSHTHIFILYWDFSQRNGKERNYLQKGK